MKEEEHWGSYLVEKDCLCRERENGAMIYFLLAGIVLLRHLFMGWAVLSFIITSFCGLSSNLYHKPNCKSYCVSFSFSSKKKKKKPNLYILELDQPHSPPLLHSFKAKSVKLWKQNFWILSGSLFFSQTSLFSSRIFLL